MNLNPFNVSGPQFLVFLILLVLAATACIHIKLKPRVFTGWLRIAVFFPTAILSCLSQGSSGVSSGASEIKVIADFPGASAQVQSIDQAARIVRIVPASPADRGWACWWYLKLEGVQVGSTITLDVGGSDFARPEQAQFSYDNITWNPTAKGDRKNGRTVYRHQVQSNGVWFAWGPPFGTRELNEMMKTAVRSPYAKNFELAKTLEGRPVRGLRISQLGTNQSRCGVWIQARQHAWEAGSSWVAHGLVAWLLSDNPSAQNLRKQATFFVVPIVDVDSVEHGFGGKDQKPHDQNRDWGMSPHFPEVRAAMDQISGLDRERRIDLFIDLHNPGPVDRNIFFYIPPTPLQPHQRVVNQQTFLGIAREIMTGPIMFNGRIGDVGSTYNPATDTSADAWVAHACGPGVVSLTMETPWNVAGSTQAGYNKTGEQLGRSIERYLRANSRL